MINDKSRIYNSQWPIGDHINRNSLFQKVNINQASTWKCWVASVVIIRYLIVRWLLSNAHVDYPLPVCRLKSPENRRFRAINRIDYVMEKRNVIFVLLIWSSNEKPKLRVLIQSLKNRNQYTEEPLNPNYRKSKPILISWDLKNLQSLKRPLRIQVIQWESCNLKSVPIED